jgi:hypothetical protein
MAKKYTQAEWARIQGRLPEEDRQPYSESPDKPEENTTAVDPYYVRNPVTGLSPAQEEANKLVAEAAAGAGKQVVPGETGESNRVLTPYQKGSTTYLGKEYATAAGAYTAAVKAAEKAGPPGPAPAGLHWNLQGTEWKLYDAEGKPFNYIGSGTEDFSGDGTADSPLLYKGKPFNGTRGGVTFVNGVPKSVSSGASGSGASGSTGPTGTPATTYTAPDGRVFTDLNDYNAYIAQLKAEDKRRAGQSAYDLLYEQFNQFGLGGLVEPLKNFITEGLSKAEFTLRLRDTDAYKKRFAANQSRVQKGLRALSEAEYINLEDQYQEIMRRYGLPESYYARGDMGRQEGFEKFIGGDVSPVELEDRIQTAQNRVINAAPEVSQALREYYPDISNGDILAYALDPSQAINNIKRKIGAAEIGAGATMAGLTTGLSRAEELQKYGVTAQQAREGYQAIGSLLPRATQLGDIYAKQGMGPFTQTTAEAEVFGTPGAVDAAAKRRKLAELESASFSGQVGAAGGALGRERAGQF